MGSGGSSNDSDFGDNWDGSMDDDLGDAYGSDQTNSYGSDGGDWSGGMSSGDNPSDAEYGAGIDADDALTGLWDKFESRIHSAGGITGDMAMSGIGRPGGYSADDPAVDVETGHPDTDVWDETNMDMIPDPMDPGAGSRFSFLSKLLQAIGILGMNPGVYGAGRGMGYFGAGAGVADSIFGDNTIRPSRTPGTDQWNEAHAGDGPSIGGGPSGADSPNGGGLPTSGPDGFERFAGHPSFGEPGSTPELGKEGGVQAPPQPQDPMQQIIATLLAGQQQQQQVNPMAMGLGGFGVKLPSGAEKRRRRTTLFGRGMRNG